MSVMQALAWKEWRSIRNETFGFAGLAVAWVSLWRVTSIVTGNERYIDVGVLALASFLLPGLALLLGASTTAGDSALSFAAARPAPRSLQVLARLGVRLAALVAITLVALAMSVILLAGGLARLAAEMPGQSDVVWMLVTLAGLLVGCFAAASLVSAHVERPLAAVFLGGGLAAMLGAAVGWALGDLMTEPESFWVVVAGAALILLMFAVRATAMRGGEAPVPLRSLLRPVALAMAGGAVVIALWPMGMSVAIDRATRSLERDLGATMPAYAAARERPPSRAPANETQARVESAARDLGFEMRRYNWQTTGAGAPSREQEAWERAQLEQPSSLVTLPAPSVLAWMDANQAGVEALRDALRSPELPRWRGGVDAWEPECSGLLQLSRILNTHALVCLARGPVGEAEALEDLEAEWRIAQALAADDGLTSQMFAMSIASRVVLMLRKFGSVPAGWEERLDVAPWRDELSDALLEDVASRIRHARQGVEHPWDRNRAPVDRWAWKPLERWDGVRLARSMVAEARAVGDAARCGADEKGSDSISGSAEMESDPFSELGRYSRLLDRLRAQMELTRATFAVRRARGMNAEGDPAGVWPTSMPGLEPSACKGLRWIYIPGDVPSIHAEGELVAWLEQGDAPKRPLRIELH